MVEPKNVKFIRVKVYLNGIALYEAALRRNLIHKKENILFIRGISI